MDGPVSPRKRSARKRGAGLESHYFSSPSSLKRQRTHEFDSEDIELHCFPLPAKSRFFQNTPDPDALLSDPAFNNFCQDFTTAFLDLYNAKPILIQGGHRHLQHLNRARHSVLSLGPRRIPRFEPLETLDRCHTPKQDSRKTVHTRLL